MCLGTIGPRQDLHPSSTQLAPTTVSKKNLERSTPGAGRYLRKRRRCGMPFLSCEVLGPAWWSSPHPVNKPGLLTGQSSL